MCLLACETRAKSTELPEIRMVFSILEGEVEGLIALCWGFSLLVRRYLAQIV